MGNSTVSWDNRFLDPEILSVVHHEPETYFGDSPDFSQGSRRELGAQITPSTSKKVSLHLAIGDDSPWLRGHFPNQPVLPGVVLLRWAVRFTARFWPELKEVRGVTNVKFQRTIVPPASVQLELLRDTEGSRVRYLYSSNHAATARGFLHYS